MSKSDYLSPEQHAENRRLAKLRKKRNKSTGLGNRETGFTLADALRDRQKHQEKLEFNENRSTFIKGAAKLLNKHQNRPPAHQMSPEEIFKFVGLFEPELLQLGIHPAEGVKQDLLDELHRIRTTR